jgi:hypothetical protein
MEVIMELALTIILTVVLGVLGFPVVVHYLFDLWKKREPTKPEMQPPGSA